MVADCGKDNLQYSENNRKLGSVCLNLKFNESKEKCHLR